MILTWTASCYLGCETNNFLFHLLSQLQIPYFVSFIPCLALSQSERNNSPPIFLPISDLGFQDAPSSVCVCVCALVSLSSAVFLYHSVCLGAPQVILSIHHAKPANPPLCDLTVSARLGFLYSPTWRDLFQSHRHCQGFSSSIFCAVFFFVTEEVDRAALLVLYYIYSFYIQLKRFVRNEPYRTRAPFPQLHSTSRALGSSPMVTGLLSCCAPSTTAYLLPLLSLGEIATSWTRSSSRYIFLSNQPERLQCQFNLSTSRVSCRVTFLPLALASIKPRLLRPLNGITGPTCWPPTIIRKLFMRLWLSSGEATININFIRSQCRLLGFRVDGPNHHGVLGFNLILNRIVSNSR